MGPVKALAGAGCGGQKGGIRSADSQGFLDGFKIERNRLVLCSSDPIDLRKPEARLDSCFEIRADAGTGARSATRLMAGQLAVDAGRMADRNAKPRVSGSICDAARVAGSRELGRCGAWDEALSQFFQTPRLGPLEASRHPSSTSRPPIRQTAVSGPTPIFSRPIRALVDLVTRQTRVLSTAQSLLPRR